MKSRNVVKAALLAVSLAFVSAATASEPWKMFDRRLGLFVHYGIYSVGGWQEQPNFGGNI